MSRYSTEQLKRGVVAPLHYNQSVVPSKNDYSSVASLLQSSTSPQNNHSQKQQQQQQQQLVLDDKSSSILTATTTTTSSSSSSAGSTNAGIETSFPRYRPDYSRAQHPVIPSHATIRTTAPSSMASSSFETSPLVTTNPSVNSLSPEQIRFEKYVNRFAAHDIRTSPLRRQKSPANTPVQSPANQSRLNSEKLSVTDRIQQFNKGGGSPKQHRLPLPQNQFSASPVRHNRKASVQSESIGKFSGVEQNCQMTNDADFTSTLTHTPCKNIAAVDIPSAKSSSPWSNRQATPRMPKVAATPTSATTMTNIPMSTSTSEQESLSSTQDRSEIPPPSLNRRIVPTRPLISDGPRSLSYDQPRNARQIEVQSPNRVADLRRKLWDNNETLQVAVPPSLHYVGGSNDDELDEDQPAVDSMSGPQRITPKMAFAALKGPEMAGRYGQRSRSLSPKRPPYVSTFKTRYYEAALASRRQAMARNELSPNVAAKSNQCSQETHDMKKRAQTKGQPYALASQENVDAESHHLHAQQSKQIKFQTGERSMQDNDPPRRVNPQQPNDYGPRKAHNFDSRHRTESQIQTQQDHLQNQMVKSSTNKLISQPQQQQRQVVSTTTITSNDGNNNQASLAWRRQSMPSLVDERSDTTGDASVAKLVAKLNSINRDNPAEALAQIDSILKAESKSDSSDLNQGRRAYSPTSPVCVQEEKKDDCEHRDGDEEEDDEDDDDDDETSMSSITNPSYMHGPWGTHNSAQALLAGQSLRPNALQLYQQRPKTAKIPHTSARSSLRATPPTTIQVKELPGPQGANQFRGHLEQLLTSDVSGESRNAAAIAMKIRMWDDLSASKSSVKLDEVNSIVPSLQEEIISATTDELGSIITPADHQMTESSASSHRESPLIMSALPTPQSSLLGAIDSLDVSGSEGQPNDLVSTGFLSPQFDVVVNSQQKENHPQRGRPLSRDDPPPPRNVSSLSSLGSRRNHPWDHHHPRNRSASRDSNSNHDDLTLNHLSSIGDNDAHKLRPIDPAPVTSPRNALPVRRDAPVQAGQRSPARGARDSSIVRSVLPFDSRGEADSRNDVDSANNGQVRSDQSNRVLATNSAEKVGDVMTSSNGSNSVQRATPGLGRDGWNEREFNSGGTFEVDPKLLRENDDFGFPIRVKTTEDRVTLFSNEFDPAWEPQATDPFFPVNASTKVLVPQQRHSKSDKLTVRDVVRAGAVTPLTSKSSNAPPVSNTQEIENGDERNRSPGRARFPMLKLKRSQDAAAPPPPPPLKKQAGDSPSKPIKVVRFEHPQDTKSADTASSSATSVSKFGLLNLKKNRDGAGRNQAGKNSESDTDRSMVKTGGRQSAGSPSRERSGSFNIVQRFNRLMRERENLE